MTIDPVSFWHESKILARRSGLKVYFTPEAWLGRFYTVNGFPSVFTVKNMDTAIKNDEGTDYYSYPIGPVSDWTHPKSTAFLHQKLEECFDKFGFDGIVWDQPLFLTSDKSMKPSVSHYFSDLNETIRRKYGSVDIILRQRPATNTTLINPKNIKGLTLTPQELVFFDHTGYEDSQIDHMSNVINGLLDRTHAMFGYYDYPSNVASPNTAMEIIAKCLKNRIKAYAVAP